jgi:hypothetical protein
MDVKLKINLSDELEAVLPPDRVVGVIKGYVSLYDTPYQITDDMIEEIIND